MGGPSAGRLIGERAAPEARGQGGPGRPGGAERPALRRCGGETAPQSAAGLAKKAPGAIGRGAVAGAKAAPGAAWKGAKLAGKGAKAAAPVAGAVGSGAAAGARRVGHGLSDGVGGDDKW